MALQDDFTMQSCVWSFAVTMWEILTLCRQKPLAHIPDHQITTLAEKYGTTATSQVCLWWIDPTIVLLPLRHYSFPFLLTLQQVWLPQPLLSPPEIFDLMRECWQINPAQRPTFQHIHLFLEQKCNSSNIYQALCWNREMVSWNTCRRGAM